MKEFVVLDKIRRTEDRFTSEAQALRFMQDLMEDLGSYDIEIHEVKLRMAKP